MADDDGYRMLNVEVPASTHAEIKAKAAAEKVTLRAVVMRCLRLGGFDIADSDMEDRRPARSGKRKAP